MRSDKPTAHVVLVQVNRVAGVDTGIDDGGNVHVMLAWFVLLAVSGQVRHEGMASW